MNVQELYHWIRSYSTFIFWGISTLLCIAVALIYIPTNKIEVILFAHIFTSICGCLWHWWWPFWLVWGKISKMWSTSSYICWPLMLLFWRIVCSVHLFIYSVDCLFCERLNFWALCIFWLLIPCRMYSWQRVFFFPFSRLSFQCGDNFHWYSEPF
jgi:hypothetical protein